jgi:hypothetical protein
VISRCHRLRQVHYVKAIKGAPYACAIRPRLAWRCGIRTRGRLPTVAVVAVLTASGCTDLQAPGVATVVLRTDRDEYVASYEGGEGSYRQYGFSVVARFENRGSTAVYLARCYPDSPHPIYGVELVDGGESWGAAYNGVWACVGHDRQIQVPPGEVRADTIHLQGPNAFDGRTDQPFGTLAGRMRLFYEVQTCPGDGACRLSEDAGMSNVFTVELAASP